MRSALLCALLACSPASTSYPVGVGPGGPGGGRDSPDAGMGSGSGSDTGPISGRVCLLTDVRDFTSCASTGADGITVALPGVASVATIADGSFVIQRPTGSDLAWSLTGTSIMPSTIGFGASTTIPAISNDAFTALAANNSVVVDPDQGSILGEIFSDGSDGSNGSNSPPAVLATTASTPVGDYPTFYASATDKDVWSDMATSTFGTFWIAGMTPGSAAMTFTADGGFPETGPTLEVGSGAVTFVTFGL